jgi:hypothetical protein
MMPAESPWRALLIERRNHHMQEHRWLERLLEAAPVDDENRTALRSWQKGVMRAVRALEGMTGLGAWDGR